MEIMLDYIEDWLLETERKKMVHPFKIYFYLDGVCYPDDEWIDNGAIIVGWWLYSLYLLKKGSQEEDFVFMEGPYRLKVSRVSDTEYFKVSTGDLRKTIEVSLTDLSLAITNCAKKIIEIFLRYGIAEPACMALEKGVNDVWSLKPK